MAKKPNKAEIVLPTANGGLTADDLQFDAPYGSSDKRYSPETRTVLDRLVEQNRERRRLAAARGLPGSD